MSAATHFGRQMKKERLARGWSLQELSGRTAYDPAHLSRIGNGVRPPTRTLAIACDAVFPERRGWFTEYYDESRQWAECYRASESAALMERVCGVWASGASPLIAGPTAETA